MFPPQPTGVWEQILIQSLASCRFVTVVGYGHEMLLANPTAGNQH